MRQRHRHPRIGPAYQATIPSLEGDQTPQVPLTWLGEVAVAEARAALAEEAAAPGATSGRGSGRTRGSGAGHKQHGAGSQASRPFTRKMRATASRNAEHCEELQQQQQLGKQAAGEAVPFSASMLAEAAGDMKQLNEALVGQSFLAGATSYTRPSDETVDAAAAAAAERASMFFQESPSSSVHHRTDAKANSETEESATGGADDAGAALSSEIPSALAREAPAESAAAIAAAVNTAATSSFRKPAATALEDAGRSPAKHQLSVTEESSSKKVRQNPYVSA